MALFLHRNADRWLSPIGVRIMRRTKGGMADSRLVQAIGAPRDLHVLLLTTRGRRSGRTRTVVLQFFPDRDGAMIVAAANDGGRSHPGWYFNLTADPDAVAEVRGRRMRVRAQELPQEEASRWWQRIVESDPSYDRYARATTRTFPILRLSPATAPEPDPAAEPAAEPAPATAQQR